MASLKENAIRLFVTNTKFKSHQIESIHQIHNGYTNISFLITLVNNQKYQIRLANDNHVVDRNNEFAMLKNIHNKDFVYYDIKTGNAIKEWIDGENPNSDEMNSKLFLDSFSSTLQKLHRCKNLNHVIKHNYYEFLDIVRDKLAAYHIDKYKHLTSKYQNLKLVLSHNDLSADNLLWNKVDKKVHFIDYEWARMNNPYWDVANFIRETDITQESINYLASVNELDIDILTDFIYICINYAYQWTFVMPQTKKILSYRKKLLTKLKKYS